VSRLPNTQDRPNWQGDTSQATCLQMAFLWAKLSIPSTTSIGILVHHDIILHDLTIRMRISTLHDSRIVTRTLADLRYKPSNQTRPNSGDYWAKSSIQSRDITLCYRSHMTVNQDSVASNDNATRTK
jgi:hypothetical protein